MACNASARLRRLRLVHNSGASGSPRVVGSTRSFRSPAAWDRSRSASCARHPAGAPARRDRIASRPLKFVQATPMVLRARPVMRDTAETPPRPAVRASAAANRRRPRSSRTGAERRVAQRDGRFVDHAASLGRSRRRAGIPPVSGFPIIYYLSTDPNRTWACARMLLIAPSPETYPAPSSLPCNRHRGGCTIIPRLQSDPLNARPACRAGL